METDFVISHVKFAHHKLHAPGYCFQQSNRKHHGLVFVEAGELTLVTPNERISVPADSILLMRQHESYRIEATGTQSAAYTVVSYLAEPEDVLLSLLPARSFVPSCPQRYRDLFASAVRLGSAYNICSQTRLRATIQDILCRIIQEHYRQSLVQKENYAETAMLFMEQNFATPLTCQQIAQAAGISDSHLRCVFRKQYGTSLTRTLNSIRIQRAKEMLQSGMFTLSETAAACGFQNEYYFSRVFKQYTGISPGKY